jgi:signal transduction histidine kinase
MAAGIAHEINNPLAIINENAGLLKDLAEHSKDYPQKEKTLTVVDSILNSVKRCSGVTRRLLGFARRMDVSHETIDLEHLVKEVVGFQRTEAAHRNIEVVYTFPPSMPSIESDRGQLQQVFLNIISNAFAAVDEGGRIDVIGAPGRTGEVTLIIKDNGKGISKENLKHVFEPFFSTKGEFGTGLGLSITRDIVRRLGGRIEAQSVEGKGTSFKVTLPLSESGRIGAGDE